jgi:5'-3' exonuclease
MGIPSYYRNLLRDHKRLVQKSRPSAGVEWLLMDFNCLIYHTLRRLGPYSKAKQVEWETAFLEEIGTYTRKVVAEVKPTKGVYIAVDGVVPMAKMRQQRLRRFKSSWLTEHGLAEGQEAGGERWDTNAITPGTAFMASLKKTLNKLSRSFVVSSSDEPGEGEHKVMEQIRQRGAGSYAVYGLDADLIVLSLLTQDTLGPGVSLWLFREQVEAGTLVRNALGEEEFQWFSIDGLRSVLDEQVVVRDYCCAMSFLGNDFLPSSLGLKMRDDGHEVLLDLLGFFKATGIRLVGSDDSIDPKGLQELLQRLSGDEEKRTEAFVRRKGGQGRAYRGAGLKLGDPNWALEQQAEASLLEGGHLSAIWRSVYRAQFLDHASVVDTCRVYLQGLHWVWDYYRGKEICYNWYYPWDVPPLWSELLAWKGTSEVPVVVKGSDILPVEQLCLVLPVASWHLIPSLKHQGLLAKAPYLFPKFFAFVSVGKRWFWECEPQIPIPSIKEVKALLA